jgi:hypothetical protein
MFQKVLQLQIQLLVNRLMTTTPIGASAKKFETGPKVVFTVATFAKKILLDLDHSTFTWRQTTK